SRPGAGALSPCGARLYCSAFRVPRSAFGCRGAPPRTPHLRPGAPPHGHDPRPHGGGEIARRAAPRRRGHAGSAGGRRRGGDRPGRGLAAREAAAPGHRGGDRTLTRPVDVWRDAFPRSPEGVMRFLHQKRRTLLAVVAAGAVVFACDRTGAPTTPPPVSPPPPPPPPPPLPPPPPPPGSVV